MTTTIDGKLAASLVIAQVKEATGVLEAKGHHSSSLWRLNR